MLSRLVAFFVVAFLFVWFFFSYSFVTITLVIQAQPTGWSSVLDLISPWLTVSGLMAQIYNDDCCAVLPCSVTGVCLGESAVLCCTAAANFDWFDVWQVVRSASPPLVVWLTSWSQAAQTCDAPHTWWWTRLIVCWTWALSHRSEPSWNRSG